MFALEGTNVINHPHRITEVSLLGTGAGLWGGHGVTGEKAELGFCTWWFARYRFSFAEGADLFEVAAFTLLAPTRFDSAYRVCIPSQIVLWPQSAILKRLSSAPSTSEPS